MHDYIVKDSLPAILIGGADVDKKHLEQALTVGNSITAADSGADRCLDHGVVPSAVIGDMDSISATARATIGDKDLHWVDEQDTTDFEKCLSRISAPLVIGVGFSGRRLDHELATLNALARYHKQPCILLGHGGVTFLSPPRISLNLSASTRVSLFPLSEVTGRSAGLRWSIEGLSFNTTGQIGTSNEALGAVELEFDQAGMLIMLPGSAFAEACQALIRAPGWE